MNKKTGLLLMLVLILCLITSCSTPEGTYKSAQSLLAKGKYSEAAEQFTSLGSYEDAATLAMYCKACALCESGDYDTGIAGFKALGNYKDCAYRITYYTARSWDDSSAGTTNYELMEHAKGIYQENPLYLDSAERITALDKRVANAKKQLYDSAVSMAEKGQYDDGIDILWHMGDYEDSWERVRYYRLREQEDALATSTDHAALLTLATDYSNRSEYLDCAKRAETLTKRANTIIGEKYVNAVSMAEKGLYEAAYHTFISISNYLDCSSELYELAYAMETAGNKAYAAIVYSEVIHIEDARLRRTALWNQIAVRDIISAGYEHTVGLKADGTVVAVGGNRQGQCNVNDWKDIIAISAGYEHTVGLKADGTVVAVGYNRKGQCNVNDWKDIIAISARYDHTVGLKADGTVVAVGDNSYGRCNVNDWKDIIAVSAGNEHTVGLKADGTVVAVGGNRQGQCNVNDWKDIIAISAGYEHTVGLKADGTVVAVGDNFSGQCNVNDWKDIVAIDAKGIRTIGLKADGTVLSVGCNKEGEYDATVWQDIIAISASSHFTIGLKADGTVLAVGYYHQDQCNISGWQLKQVYRPQQ